MKQCELPGCSIEFEAKAGKKFCCKQHKDRSYNAHYKLPVGVTWESIEELRHFGKLSDEGKQRVLLGDGKFSVVMFDIEATHLKPNVGRIICCSFKPIGGEVYTFHALEKRNMKRDVYDDSSLAGSIRDELEKYDIIVGWNSKDFDLRFINSRNLRVRSRTKRAQYHVDGLWAWKSKASAWAGLSSIQQFVDLETSKTKIDWRAWMRVLGWDKKLREEALAEIVDHCERDVTVLEQAYRILVETNVIRSLRRDGGIL